MPFTLGDMDLQYDLDKFCGSSLLKVCKDFLQCYCCCHGFNTVTSILNTANSLGNVYTAIILYKVRHTDCETAENEQTVPCYMCKSHAKVFFFSSFGGGGVLLLFNPSFWPISTSCSISRQFISVYFKSTELDRGNLSSSVIKENITIIASSRHQKSSIKFLHK